MTHTPAAAADPATPSRIFRGWFVLAGIFVVMTVASGFAFYAQGVFLDALVNEQGFSVSLAGAGTGTFFLTTGVGGYFAGGLISRFDVRIVITGGALLTALGIALMGEVRTTWQMFAVFFIFGCGYAFAGLVPTTSLVTRWFNRRRSLALAIGSTGLSVGGIAITPVLAKLIESRSLAELALTFALVYVCTIVPVTWLVLRPSPELLGLGPDGDPPAAGDGPQAELPGIPFAEAVRSRFFVVMSAAFVLIMSAQVGALQHVFKLTKDRIDIDGATTALIVVTSTSVCARIVGGIAAMRVSLLRLAMALVVVQAIGIAIIGIADNLGLILFGCVVLGSAMGNLLMLHPLLLAEAFGVRDYSRIYGLGALLMVLGVGLGPFIVGVLRDAFSYQTAFVLMAGLALVGLGVLRTAVSPATKNQYG